MPGRLLAGFMTRLIVRSSGSAAQILELNPGVNRLGRGTGNDHVLDDALVSQWHCEILLEGGFILVRDLGSTNGTFIEGRPIKEATLYPGQVLRIGPLELVLDAPPMRLAIPELPGAGGAAVRSPFAFRTAMPPVSITRRVMRSGNAPIARAFTATSASASCAAWGEGNSNYARVAAIKSN